MHTRRQAGMSFGWSLGTFAADDDAGDGNQLESRYL